MIFRAVVNGEFDGDEKRLQSSHVSRSIPKRWETEAVNDPFWKKTLISDLWLWRNQNTVRLASKGMAKLNMKPVGLFIAHHRHRKDLPATGQRLWFQQLFKSSSKRDRMKVYRKYVNNRAAREQLLTELREEAIVRLRLLKFVYSSREFKFVRGAFPAMVANEGANMTLSRIGDRRAAGGARASSDSTSGSKKSLMKRVSTKWRELSEAERREANIMQDGVDKITRQAEKDDPTTLLDYERAGSPFDLYSRHLKCSLLQQGTLDSTVQEELKTLTVKVPVTKTGKRNAGLVARYAFARLASRQWRALTEEQRLAFQVFFEKDKGHFRPRKVSNRTPNINPYHQFVRAEAERLRIEGIHLAIADLTKHCKHKWDRMTLEQRNAFATTAHFDFMFPLVAVDEEEQAAEDEKLRQLKAGSKSSSSGLSGPSADALRPSPRDILDVTKALKGL